MPRLACSLSVATLALLTLAPSARAQAEGPPGETPRYPVAQAERPLTLPKLVLDAEADVDFPHVGGFFGNVSLGASFGIVDDFTVRAVVLPLQLFGPGTAGFHYGQTAPLGDADAPGPGFGLTYRFLRGVVEVGASLDFSIITAAPSSGVSITPASPYASTQAGGSASTPASTPRHALRRTSTIPEGAGGPMTAATPSARGASRSPCCAVRHHGADPRGRRHRLRHRQPRPAGDVRQHPRGALRGLRARRTRRPRPRHRPVLHLPDARHAGRDTVTQAAAYVFGVSVGGFFYL